MTEESSIIPVRSINVDIIRVLAMLMVIVMHTVFNFTERTDFFATKLWFLLEPFMAVSKTCVLLFFMLSGYLVISKQRSIHHNWLKIRQRLLIPLLFFSGLTVCYTFFTWSRGGSDWTVSSFILAQIVRMTTFPSSPLWFLGVLVILYSLNPLWSPIFARDQKSDIARYLTCLAFVFSITAHFIQFPGMKNGIFFTSFTGWLAYVFFYLYGGLVKNNWIDYRNIRRNIILVVFGVLTTMLGDWYTMYTRYYHIETLWAGYTTFLSLPVILTAVGLFNLLITIRCDFHSSVWRKQIGKLIQWFAKLSFGIYLIHTFVVSFLTDLMGFNFDNLAMNVYLYNFLNYILVLGVSTILTIIILKLKKINVLIGGPA